MTRIEEKSKSLNKILESLPDEKKVELRAWWRKKINGYGLSIIAMFIYGVGFGIAIGVSIKP